ncbi:MAG: putative cation efflux [Rhodospirillaceae bacterium]|nr:MAG: putative cation efflux [Rhodospirillaceae bacterium]TNC93478.1 MAG: putative cation efflux transporter [Stygiobacter sp.]
MISADHSHVYLGASQQRNERRTWVVIALTSVTMVAEIVAGTVFGSMALVADGWHMSTHAAALLIAALAYLFARRHAHDPRYSFGTGRLGDLAAFASAVVLALVALQITWESSRRLLAPVEIHYSEAIFVAVLGLVVNLVSAWLLHDGHHDHDHDHHHGHDNNLRAAYMHVIADALTSVLAIAALLLGRAWNWPWLDPLIGVVGALVIARWSWGLMTESGAVLVGRLDAAGAALPGDIRAALDNDRDRITDLHVWQVGPGHHAVIVVLTSTAPQAPDFYKRKLRHLGWISHLTLEIQPLELDSLRLKA